MRKRFIVAAAAAFAFAGCSGGGSGPVSPGGGTTGSGNGGSSSNARAATASAISDANAVGTPLDNFSQFDKMAGSALSGVQTSARTRDAAGTGVCRSGVEFYSPDRNGDPNSTETIAFYDTACTSEARDTVRTYSPNGSSGETVNVTELSFAAGNATPIATRTATHAISNASFNQFGYPVAASGYDLVATDSLAIGTAKTIDSGREFVLQPASGGVNGFCSDSAGYNAVGIASTGNTFGWAGGVASGTRTVNGDGSVTWSATHAGTAYEGGIGSLSIATGTPNTACPIASPDFTLAGGTSIGSYTIPVTATFGHGVLQSLSIVGASLANGDTLDVTTNAGQAPSSEQFVTGSISKGTTQTATFAVDAFGDGALTVTATGAQYVITDWHVVR